MLLAPDQQQKIAQKAQWYFDCYFGPPGDYVTFTGDGVDDLDKLIDRLNTNAAHNLNRNQRFMCDVGAQYSDWRPFDIEDVFAIRAFYISYYGNVNKPDAYAAGSNTAIPVPTAVQP